MKTKSLIPLILFLLTSCGYKSEFEAMQACKEWAGKQEGIYLSSYDYVKGTNEVGEYISSKCKKDGERTRKILGLKLNRADFGSEDSPVGEFKSYIFYDENFKVIKRFSY